MFKKNMSEPLFSGSVSVNEFVRRQVAASPFSHYEGGVDGAAGLARIAPISVTPGYRDGVILVRVDPKGFFCGVVEVTPETVLRAKFAPRREGEAPFISVEAVGGTKLPAAYVELVLYRHDVLVEDGSNSTDTDWELVSINARPTEGHEPLTPMAMARNQLGLPGGTAAMYTSEQWAESVRYWSTRAMIAG